MGKGKGGKAAAAPAQPADVSRIFTFANKILKYIIIWQKKTGGVTKGGDQKTATKDAVPKSSKKGRYSPSQALPLISTMST